MKTAYLGLGSNLGNRMAFLRGGRDALVDKPGIDLVCTSGVYETEAIGGPPDNPQFLNTALQISTTLTPQELLQACLSVEDDFGRSRPVRWAPRTLDIDILFYEDLVVCEEDLTIPHPRLHERAFVLAPLLEIAPDFRHPLLDQSVSEIASGSLGVAELTPVRESW